MKTKIKSILGMIAVLAIFPFFYVSCSDDEETWASVDIPEQTDVMNLDMWSQSIPLEIKSNGSWLIETVGDEFFYVYPSRGEGNVKTTLYIDENSSLETQTGEICIKSGNSILATIQLKQKCESDYPDNGMPNLDGNRKYFVGYGFNVYTGEKNNKGLKKSILNTQMIKNLNLIEFTPNSSASFQEHNYLGSSAEELSNQLLVEAGGGGNIFRVRTEMNALFGMTNLNSENNEFALSRILYDMGELTIDTQVFDETTGAELDFIPNMLSRTARNAINGTKDDYAGVEGAMKLIEEYGTHLIMKVNVGGKLDYALTVNTSKVSGAYDLEAFAKASYDGLKMKSSGSVDEKFKESYSKSVKEDDLHIYASGGNQSVFMGSQKDADALNEWKSSLKSDLEEFNLGVIDFSEENGGLVPLENFVFFGIPCKDNNGKIIRDENGLIVYERDEYDNILEDMEKKHKRQVEIQSAIKHYLEGSSPEMKKARAEYMNCTELKMKVPTFDDSKPYITLVNNVFAGGELKAVVCNEYIPVINQKNRVTVIYPVISKKIKYNMGFFIGDEAHKPARVCWDANGNVVVSEYKDLEMGAPSQIYVMGSSVYTEAINQKNVVEGTAEKEYLKTNKYGKTGLYPLVKIYNNYWLREDFVRTGTDENSKEMINDGHGDGFVHPWYGRVYYSAEALTEYNLPPHGWRIPTADDYRFIIKNNVSTSITIGDLFRTPYKSEEDRSFAGSSLLGFEAATGHRPTNNDAYPRWDCIGSYDGYAQWEEGDSNHNYWWHGHGGDFNDYWIAPEDGKYKFFHVENNGYSIEPAEERYSWYRRPIRICKSIME